MSEQAAVFFGALLLGAVLGCIYDIFRVTRLAFRMPALLILLEDLIYFLFAGIILFSYLLRASNGQIRYFILLGVAGGWAAYYFTLGKIVMKCSQAIISFLKKTIEFLLRPFVRLFRFLRGVALRIQEMLIKAAYKAKNTLKNQATLLYNRRKRPDRENSEGREQKMAKTDTRQKKQKGNALDGLLKLLTIALFILLVVFLVRSTMSYAAMEDELAAVNAKIQEETLAIKDKELTLRDEEEFWERQARELDYAYPEEEVWVFDTTGDS